MNDILEKYNKDGSNGIPMYTKKNITIAAKNELDLLTRKVLADNQITKEDFVTKFKIYGDTLNDLPKHVIANRQVNLLSAIAKGNLTFNRLKECICHVLRFKLVNIKLTFKTEKDETYEVNLRND